MYDLLVNTRTDLQVRRGQRWQHEVPMIHHHPTFCRCRTCQKIRTTGPTNASILSGDRDLVSLAVQNHPQHDQTCSFQESSPKW